MKTFEYTIKDELGIHARPAGMLVKEAKNFASECTITKDGKTKKLTQLMMLMKHSEKQGDTIKITANEEEENEENETMKKNKEEKWVENIVLNEALKGLSERERKIIDMRFFNGKTQMEIADEIGISQAQVSRLEKNALKAMKKYME